jgi:DNA-binding NtrC family response regulator
MESWLDSSALPGDMGEFADGVARRLLESIDRTRLERLEHMSRRMPAPAAMTEQALEVIEGITPSMTLVHQGGARLMVEKFLIGESATHRQILEKLSKIAGTDAEVLISGPSGVGKELYARYVHQCSLRHKAEFVPVNCGALPVDLLENELFGHVSGAFTGASPRSDGLVAAAESGTLFLDEVDALALGCQVKLLRFLQEKEYRRLGETRMRRANVRIIAATNTDLLAAVHDGRFREDLFFRLRVVPIEVPALCERPSDIPLLLEEYVTRYAEAYKLPQITLSSAALERLMSYAWPGNVRELENCVNYLTCLQLDRPVQPCDLPLLSAEEADGQATDAGSDRTKRPYSEAKRDVVENFEREYIKSSLYCSEGNIAKAARVSGKSRRVFFELMRKHGISAASYRLMPSAAEE